MQAHGSDLEAVARTLARLGYSVKLCASAGGSLHSLKHTFITAARHAAAAPHGESQSPAPCCMCRQPASQHAAPQHLPTTLLPLMTPCCHHTAKLAAAAMLPSRFPSRCCR